MRGNKFKFIFLTFTLLLFLLCLSGIHASNDTGTVVAADNNCALKSVEKNYVKQDNVNNHELNVTVNEVKSNDYLTYTSINGKITTYDKKLPNNSNIHYM